MQLPRFELGLKLINPVGINCKLNTHTQLPKTFGLDSWGVFLNNY